MFLPSFSVALVGFVTLASSSPVAQAPGIPGIAPEHCNELQSTVDPACYEELGVEGWLDSWYSAHVCPAQTADDGNCCNLGEPWSQCFLRIWQGSAGTDCTQLGKCNTYIPSINPDIAPVGIAHYVVYNIYKINTFFTQWNAASQSAVGLAKQNVGGIVSTINPPSGTGVIMNDILTSLTAAMAFASVPAVASDLATFGLTADTAAVSGALTYAMQQAPSVAAAIWPPGNLNTEHFDFHDLSAGMGNIGDLVTDSISAGLLLIMTNVTAFTSFARNGTFSSADPPSLDPDTPGLDWSFKTFLLSSALFQTGYDVAVQDNTVANAASTANAVQNPETWFCGSQRVNLCYAIQGKDSNILTKVLSPTNHWTNGDLLLDGATTCLIEGKASSTLISFGANNALDLNCISRMNVCKATADICNPGDTTGVCGYPACRAN